MNFIGVHKKRLVRTKFIFSAATLGLISGIISFSILLKGFSYIYAETKIGLAAFTYKIGFARANSTNLLSSVLFAATGKVSWEIHGLTGGESAGSVPVLVYHGIVDKPNGSDVTVENFQKQMFALKKAGYQTITMEEFVEFTNKGKRVPARSFLLTFDDGRKDSYYPVDPILNALGYNAVMFVITRYSLLEESGPYYLSLMELKNLVKSGRWEIGMHTRDGHTFYHIDPKGTPGHFYSDKLWVFKDGRQETTDEFRARIHDDFLGSYQEIKNALGIAAAGFAYPFGDYGQNSTNFPEAKDIVPYETSRVYPVAFHQGWIGEGFTGNYPDPGLYLKKRFDVRPEWTPSYIVNILNSGQSKSLPYTDRFDHSEKNDWIRLWGQVMIKDGALRLDTASRTNGTAALLNGSAFWENYSLEANVGWQKGSHATIFVRMRDRENYVSCDFGRDQVFIGQRMNSKDRQLISARHFPILNYDNLSLGVKVRGNQVSCLINGIEIASTGGIDQSLSRGGIGFKIWDGANNNAELVINGIHVESL